MTPGNFLYWLFLGLILGLIIAVAVAGWGAG